jgi:hypothetical protein
MTAMISLDGVLRTEVGDPIHTGLKLFRTMLMTYRVAVATDGTLEEAEHWLRSNLLTGYAEIYSNSVAFEGQDLRLRQLAIAKQGGPVEVFVDADVDRCAAVLSSGTPVLLFGSPKFVRRKREVKPWSHIKDEIEAQKELTAQMLLDGPLDRWE